MYPVFFILNYFGTLPVVPYGRTFNADNPVFFRSDRQQYMV